MPLTIGRPKRHFVRKTMTAYFDWHFLGAELYTGSNGVERMLEGCLSDLDLLFWEADAHKLFRDLPESLSCDGVLCLRGYHRSCHRTLHLEEILRSVIIKW